MSKPIKSKNYNLIGYSGTEIPAFLSDMTDNNDMSGFPIGNLDKVLDEFEKK